MAERAIDQSTMLDDPEMLMAKQDCLYEMAGPARGEVAQRARPTRFRSIKTVVVVDGPRGQSKIAAACPLPSDDTKAIAMPLTKFKQAGPDHL